VLVDTAQIVTIHCGGTQPREHAGCVEAVFAGGGADIYVIAGPTPLDAVRRYNLLCGGGVLPPRWGLGFWHRVHQHYDAEQTLAEAGEFAEREIPCDVIGLEPGWQTASYPCSFVWSPERFPDSAGFLDAMRQSGLHVNLWEHAYVSPSSPIHEALSEHSGSYTVWGGLVPDLTDETARKVFGEYSEREHIDRGVSGYKLDECDGAELTGQAWMFPAHAAFPSGLDGEQMRQIYGLAYQNLAASLFRKRNQRTYGLVRASNAGAAPLPYVLYSDLYDHPRFVRALCNSGFSGLLWAPEVRSASTALDWVRRMQLACFAPLAMLNAWASGTKPWSFPEVEDIVRDAIRMRMRLMPYFYSAFARYHEDGTPPFRAMALDMPGAEEVDDQFMVGDSLLVAPMLTGRSFDTQTIRDVLLPPGDWFDFNSGERIAGGRVIQVEPGMDTIPVYVRDGGIVPLMPPLQHAPNAGDDVPLEVRHYGSAPGRYRLYDDDGVTFDYENGAYRWTELRVERDASGALRGDVAGVDGDGPGAWGDLTWRFMSVDRS
jgi:alpha-glucosidase (family GH31 glycosyl hydrolase)